MMQIELGLLRWGITIWEEWAKNRVNGHCCPSNLNTRTLILVGDKNVDVNTYNLLFDHHVLLFRLRLSESSFYVNLLRWNQNINSTYKVIEYTSLELYI
jgi:hypothetical protein